MVTTAIFRHFRPHRHRRFLIQNATSCVPFSSSSSSNSDDNDQNRVSPPKSQFSFSDVTASLKHTAVSPKHTRRPSFYNSNPSTREDATQKVVSLPDISKTLSNFSRKPSVQPPQSPASGLTFQELYIKTQKSDTGSGSENAVKRGAISMDLIRSSLKNIQPSQSQSQPKVVFGESQMYDSGPKSSKEMLNGKSTKGEASNGTKYEFVRLYAYGDMGKMLRKLRSGNKNVKFSLAELNERLQMVREMDEKKSKEETKYGPLRDSLAKIKDANKKEEEKAKKVAGSIGSLFANQDICLNLPPKDVLVEKYFHPDHMSSAEKQKIKLKNVREKFKISESDCGSARVQVAQLTTKIKHLATVLHKKDKHSRKGLQAMVQKRKKLLKYLRRTDWDSYCFCLSELGLRDSADYKA